MSDVVLNIKTNFSNDSITKANSEINKYIKGATGAAEKADKFGKVQAQLDKATSALKGSLGSINNALGKFPMLTGGVTLGLSGLIHSAWEMNKTIVGMQNELKHLSDSSGDVNGAWNVMMGSWSNSIASLATIKGAMTGLASAGMQVGPAMQNLTTFVSNLHQATGISSEKMAQLTGELNSYWKVSVQGSREVVSSVLAAQKAFGSTTAQMEQFMGTIIESQNRIGALGKDGEASAKALAKGITMASGALIKMGVNAQTATSFIDKLMDPDRFDETSGLLRRIGISIEDQFKMMESAGGKEMFFDKLLTNLPKLATEIQSISNPLARWRYAKGLGLPPEIAAKMSTASAGQMRTIMEEYKSQAEGEKAAAEKQKKAQADAARFDEQIQFMKMKILSPMISFVMQAYNKLMKGGVIDKITTVMQKVVGWIADGMSKIFNAITPIMDAITGKGNMKDAVIKSVSNVVDVVLAAIKKNMPMIMGILKELMKGAISVFFQLFKEHPLLMSALVGGKAMSGIGSMVGFAGTLKNLGVIKGIPGISGVGSKLAGGAAGLLGKAGPMLGAAAKFAGPIGLAISAIMGGVSGFKSMDEYMGKKEGRLATTGEKMGGATAGAMTLGIAPMIDKIFGTQITPTLGKHMKNILLFSPLAPAGILLHAMEAFSDKALTLEQENDRVQIKNKILLGQKLTTQEKKRYEEIQKIQEKNHVTMRQGFINLKNNIVGIFTGLPEKLSKLGTRIGKWFDSVGWWIHDKILFPIRMGFGELWANIREGLSQLPFGPDKVQSKRYRELVEQIQGYRTSGRSGALRGMAITGVDAEDTQTLRKMATIAAESIERENARDKQALLDKQQEQIDKQKEANERLAGIGANTATTAENTKPKTIAESDFFKSFVGGYGNYSFSMRT